MSDTANKSTRDEGVLLGTCRRFNEGSASYRFKTYAGHGYVEVHVVKLGKPDRWITIPVREIDDVIAFLSKAKELSSAGPVTP